MTTLQETDARVLAEAWAEADPDPETRAETRALLDLDRGSPVLTERFGTRLQFGTAGLRGRLGAGPDRMNRVLVRVVASALAQRVGREGGTHVVVGFDARHKSRHFAEDTARVMAAHGIACTIFASPVPTPALAFAVQQLGADAGVMVTASHNPRTDNGYKVYWQGGAQIVPPVDTEISELIGQTPLLTDADLAPLDDDAISVAGDELLDAYLEAAVSVLHPAAPRSARVAYTPLHGVGAELLGRAFDLAGFPAPAMVEEQREPDPDFPTTPFPNPEETGVLEPLLRLGTEMSADVALANDPDADRLSVAVPNGDAWTLLSGDEVGCLLAEYLLAGRSAGADGERTPLVINTVVSSRLLEAIAHHHGAEYCETLTGFKWIMDAESHRPTQDFVMGYEEALGYAVGTKVRDKDGISAALVIAEMVSVLAAEGRTLLDLRDDIHATHGVHAAGQRSIRFESTNDTPVMAQAMIALREHVPASIAGIAVSSVEDLARGEGSLPSTDAVILHLDGGRVVVRPSGTEPKMKVYGEVVTEPGTDLDAARASARATLTALLDAAVSLVAEPESAARTGAIADDHALIDRAARLASALPTGYARAQDLRLIVRCVDLTTLEGDDTPGRIRALCAQARRPDPADPTVGPTAAVCVYPSLVPLAAELTGGGVRVASVAGAFPSALSSLEVRLADIGDAVASGAHEVDIVLNRSAFLAGDHDQVATELRASIAAAGTAHSKVIIEVGELRTVAAVREATLMAIDAGAHVVKTSTGKSGVSATPASVLVMAETIRDRAAATGDVAGLKIAGGVRTAADALGYVAIVRAVLGDAWLTPDRLRFGASSLLTAVLADLAATEGSLRSRS